MCMKVLVKRKICSKMWPNVASLIRLKTFLLHLKPNDLFYSLIFTTSCRLVRQWLSSYKHEPLLQMWNSGDNPHTVECPLPRSPLRWLPPSPRTQRGRKHGVVPHNSVITLSSPICCAPDPLYRNRAQRSISPHAPPMRNRNISTTLSWKQSYSHNQAGNLTSGISKIKIRQNLMK